MSLQRNGTVDDAVALMDFAIAFDDCKNIYSLHDARLDETNMRYVSKQVKNINKNKNKNAPQQYICT